MDFDTVFKGNYHIVPDLTPTTPILRDLEKNNLITYSEYTLFELDKKLKSKIATGSLPVEHESAYQELIDAIDGIRNYYMKVWTITNFHIRRLHKPGEGFMHGITIRIEGSRGYWFVTGYDIFNFFKESDDDQVYRYRVPYLNKIPRIFTEKLDIVPISPLSTFPSIYKGLILNYDEVAQFGQRPRGVEDPRYWNIIKNKEGKLVRTYPKDEEFVVNYKSRPDLPGWFKTGFEANRDDETGFCLRRDGITYAGPGEPYDPFGNKGFRCYEVYKKRPVYINQTIDGKVVPPPKKTIQDKIKNFFKKSSKIAA